MAKQRNATCPEGSFQQLKPNNRLRFDTRNQRASCGRLSVLDLTVAFA